MSIDGSTNNVTAIEMDMRDVLRARKARLSDVSRETNNDYSSRSLVFQFDRFRRSITSLRASRAAREAEQ